MMSQEQIDFIIGERIMPALLVVVIAIGFFIGM